MSNLELISDFNIGVFGRYLEYMDEMSGYEIKVAPFGQVFQNLLKPNSGEVNPHSALVWTRPESILRTYQDCLVYKTIDHDTVLDELNGYIDALREKAANVKYLLHPTWILPVGERGYGMLDYSQGLGLSNLVARLNIKMVESLTGFSNIFFLNTEPWIRNAGPRSAPAKMWFSSKVPYSNTVFKEAASDIAAAIAGLEGKARKIVIVDLDNTLWGGIVGETGWQGVRLGGHDHVGEAFVQFQRRLKALRERGVQLAIVSKNDESVAIEAINKHPEMLLRLKDFADWRINWLDKAQNIVDIVSELRLGLDSVVFIDDNPAERGRVRDALGDRVLVPDWPEDPANYSSALSALKCFDTPSLSFEDRNRGNMYLSEKERRKLRKQVGSIDVWLESLEMTVVIEPLSKCNLPRAVQLLNKTNQMNMATRRLSEQELKDWINNGERQLWTFRLSDRFGDSGLCGLISIDIGQDTAHIVDFVMSCRIMGRKLEELMVHSAVEYSRKVKRPTHIVASFIKTDRNRPCLEFWKRSGFVEREENQFYWDTENQYPIPGYFSLG